MGQAVSVQLSEKTTDQRVDRTSIVSRFRAEDQKRRTAAKLKLESAWRGATREPGNGMPECAICVCNNPGNIVKWAPDNTPAARVRFDLKLSASRARIRAEDWGHSELHRPAGISG